MPWVDSLQSSSAGTRYAVDSAAPSRMLNPHNRNYDHVAGLWEYEGWLPESSVDLARSHYSAYMVRRKDGLRVISLNTDLCT